MSPALVPVSVQNDAVERALELHLMGFGRAESRTVVTEELSYGFTDGEWNTVYEEMKTALRQYELKPEEFAGDLNTALQRAAWIQDQLLAVFQNMTKNYQAYSEGRPLHDPDPETGEQHPVLAVKPLDLAQMGEKIMKIDQDRLSAKLNFPGHLQKAQEALAYEARSRQALPSHSDMMSDFSNDIQDADFKET